MTAVLGFALSMIIGNDFGSYISSMFIAWGFVPMICSFASYSEKETKALSYTAIAFASKGRDLYLNGQGNILGRLAEVITLFDAKGNEMNVSAAVTYLSESLIVPSCAMQKFIHWKSIDQNNAKASIEYHGVKIPSKMKAVWNLPGGDYEYFNGTITDIVYNCKQAS